MDVRFEPLLRLLARQLGVEREDLVPEARFLDDLGADSLDLVELVMALEEVYGIRVPDTHLETLRTIGDVERYVLARAAVAVRVPAGEGRAIRRILHSHWRRWRSRASRPSSGPGPRAGRASPGADRAGAGSRRPGPSARRRRRRSTASVPGATGA